MRRSSKSVTPDDSELEQSFASTSLNSPPLTAREIAFSPDRGEPMDISPAPLPSRSLFGKTLGRPRASTTSTGRLFHDVSNQSTKPAYEHGTANSTSNKRIQRQAIPLEWMASAPEPANEESDDAMDVDTSSFLDCAPSPMSARSPYPVMPRTAAPTVTTFSNLFYETSSPNASFQSPPPRMPRKRRSLSPERSPGFSEMSSPGDLPISPSDLALQRAQNKPSLLGLGRPSDASKRPRRPVLSALIQPTGPSHPIHSAYPTTERPADEPLQPAKRLPARRAFSAMIPANNLLSDDSSFEGQDSSPAAAYMNRNQARTLRRCDGTDNFKTNAPSPLRNESPITSPRRPLPGFADQEEAGKILPCHRVSQDGLMRISAQTLNDVLDGVYDSKMVSFQIVDCRFQYEYAGGHIAGALNVNTQAELEPLLFGAVKPKPSVSGDSCGKTVLIFHCEFSAVRAPTFAKHLRAKDRSVNTHLYPKIHYPEVYILEGGYCNYFKTSSHRCEPRAYVTMDDPEHAVARREDIDQFRKNKFGRHRSYTYGDLMQNKMSSSSNNSFQAKGGSKRTSAPTNLFAAATNARRASGLVTLAESSPSRDTDDGDTDVDIGDSPCPPPPPRKRMSLARAETYVF
ncbi:hypothetical protein CYLTODRAFT_340561 [Cylindrobasidium torrendii FP15055 ss-10]|uniref:M-phase inducer phosphatase n=1 Tax=Cylindrobasidium torrendii FP15055 ss-10 TaxID=1314674 RepID=A0A0D7BVZ0_9AGAR|nr:hypothetical protein CYLTODRAFT_340561 [Cylindrobasidium torrendii FP15055 ss-10]